MYIVYNRNSTYIVRFHGVADTYSTGFSFKNSLPSLKKQAETLFWLICCERKILFRLKKQAKKMDYKINEQASADECREEEHVLCYLHSGNGMLTG